MINQPSPDQGSRAMQILFGDDVRTPAEKRLLAVCKTSASLSLAGSIAASLTNHAPHWLQTVIIVPLVAVVLIFFASFCILGVKAAGRSNGRQNFLTQTMFVLSRVGLYIFLPCGLITATIILIMWAEGKL